MWIIERTDEVAKWISVLDDDAKEAILKNLFILSEIGPSLGRPYVDSVKRSKHSNMKELRVQCKRKLIRILFAFDPDRKAILLIGEDKRGNKKFYQTVVPKADKLYDAHLKRIQKK